MKNLLQFKKPNQVKMIGVSYDHDLDEVVKWCNENIGKNKESWMWGGNAHNYIFFIPEESVTFFMLRWGNTK
jgi:hypothetical protein